MLQDKNQTSRRLALFFAIMASGGSLLVSREIWVTASLLFLIKSLKGVFPASRKYQLIYIWIAITVCDIGITQGFSEVFSILSRFLTFVTAALLTAIYASKPKYVFADDLSFIIKPMTVQAIVTFIAGNLNPQMFSSIEIAGITYFHIAYVLLFHYVHNMEVPFIRPDGFFYEPGVFQIYLSIFVFVNLFVRKNIKWAIIGFVALISTASTIGLVVATALIAYFPFSQRKSSKAKSLIVSISVLAFVLPVVAMLAKQNIDEKIYGEHRGSYVARNYDLLTGINIIVENPILGIGFLSDRYVSEKSYSGSLDTTLPGDDALIRQNSNGIVQIFFSIGIPLGAFMLLGIIRQRMMSPKFIFVIIILASLLGQALSFSTFFLMIAFSGMIYERARDQALKAI